MTLGNDNNQSLGKSGSSAKKNKKHEAVGATVTESGIALVHEGELIFPAPDSEAEAELAIQDARTTITVNLPVIVQVAGANDTAETDRIVNETLRRLRHAIEAQGPVV